MPENTAVLRTRRSAKCKKWLHVAAIVFGFVSIGGCFVLASLTYILFGDCEDCSTKAADQEMVKVMRILATVLFLLGILLIAMSLCCKGTENSLAPQTTVVSNIPVEDLEKSPAPVLAYNHIPHRQAFTELDGATNLPTLELTTTVDDIDEISNSSTNEGFWTEEIEGPITPPPSYEEALVMRWPIVVVKENGANSSEDEAQSVRSEDTGL